MHDVVIIGGGPAGVAAAVYAARKKMRTVLVAESFGGQSIVSADIHNWIGEKSISGIELAKRLEAHARAYEGADLEIRTVRAEGVLKIEGGFSVKLAGGDVVESKTVLVASGSSRKRLHAAGEDRLDGKGVVYCSTCDAPLFGGMDVAVVGGGNAGLEAVHDLSKYAKRIYLLVRGGILRGDQVTQAVVRALPMVEIIFDTEIAEITGDAFVSGARVKNMKTGEEKILELSGVFIEIGSVPNSDLVKGVVDLDAIGRIVTDAKTGRSSVLGIWAAGDVADGLYQQNNIAAGEAIRAILNISTFLTSGS